MMQDDDGDTYAVAIRRAQERTQAVIRDAIKALDILIQERESRMARNAAWFEKGVVQPYREAGSPYGDSRAAAIQWFREQHKNRAAD